MMPLSCERHNEMLHHRMDWGGRKLQVCGVRVALWWLVGAAVHDLCCLPALPSVTAAWRPLPLTILLLLLVWCLTVVLSVAGGAEGSGSAGGRASGLSHLPPGLPLRRRTHQTRRTSPPTWQAVLVPPVPLPLRLKVELTPPPEDSHRWKETRLSHMPLPSWSEIRLTTPPPCTCFQASPQLPSVSTVWFHNTYICCLCSSCPRISLWQYSYWAPGSWRFIAMLREKLGNYQD